MHFGAFPLYCIKVRQTQATELNRTVSKLIINTTKHYIYTWHHLIQLVVYSSTSLHNQVQSAETPYALQRNHLVAKLNCCYLTLL